MHDIGYLNDILIMLFASVAIVIVFKQMGLSPAIGYLAAGAAIGPFGLGFLENSDITKSIAELGVVFLLFALGLELTFSRLMEMKKYVLGFGGLQVVVSSFAISYICYAFFGLSLEMSVVIGSALSLSSTAVVIQVLNENGEQSTRVGRLSFSVLLMQDLAVIPILVLIPLLAKAHMDIMPAIGGALTNALIAMAIIFIAGRLLLRPLYRMIAETKSDVLFLSFTLIIVLGAAYLSHKLGLSFALGAFIAGLMVAETEYKYRVEEEILSLKALLMGLFFMTIGMSFDFELMIKSFPYLALAALGLIFIKSFIIVALCRLFRFPIGPSLHTGLLLSQGGEFSFMIFFLALNQKFIDQDVSQFLMTVTTLTMALTPMLASFGRNMKMYFYTKETLRDNKIRREIGDIENHVIIVGFSKVGRVVAHILRKKGINYIVLDNNHRMVRIEKNNGYNIYYGDAQNVDVLRYIGAGRARSIIVAMEDEVSCMKITRFIHKNFPDVSVVTKSENFNNTERFKKIGASLVVSKNLETGLQLGSAALTSVGISSEEINSLLNTFRDINSEVIRDVVSTSEKGI